MDLQIWLFKLILALNDLVPGETIYFRVIEYDSDEFGSFGICAFEPISALHELTGASINIHPNPARSFLKIDIEGFLEFEVKLYNLIGQEVISEKNISSINLNDIAQGTYIIKIFDLNSSNSISEKIIITK